MTSELKYKAWGELRIFVQCLADTVLVYRPVWVRGRSITTGVEGFGLMYYRARWYDLILTDSPNLIQLYQSQLKAFKHMTTTRIPNNNPVRYSDPSGHKVCDYSCQIETEFADPNYEHYANDSEWDVNKQAQNKVIVKTILEIPAKVVLGTIAPPIGFVFQIVSNEPVSAIDLAFGLLPLGDAAGLGDEVANLGKLLKFDKNQNALIQLAKEAAKIGGVTADETKILLNWADEYKVLSHGPEIHPNRNFNVWHIMLAQLIIFLCGHKKYIFNILL